MDNKDRKIHKLVADVLELAEGKALLVRYKDVKKYDSQKGCFLPDDYLVYTPWKRPNAFFVNRLAYP